MEHAHLVKAGTRQRWTAAFTAARGFDSRGCKAIKHSMCMPRRVVLFLLLYLLGAHARPEYTDASNSTFALVLCSGLKEAVWELRHREIDEHRIGVDWLEENCVSIDPCAGTSSNTDAVGLSLSAPPGVWLAGNSSALVLPRSHAAIVAAEAGVRAENYGSLEFARVPEGLLLQACAPDFDLWRRTGAIACNEKTIMTIHGRCPGAEEYTLLDCIVSLQFDATVDTLVYRPRSEKMHFGTRTWNEACAAEVGLPGIVSATCELLGDYTIEIPVPAVLGSTSLVRYEFLQGYGCHRQQPEDERMILSRVPAPNKMVPCPVVANGSTYASDMVSCTTECNAGFVLVAGQCVSECAGMLSACPAGHFATAECLQGTLSFYNCSRCPEREGHEAAQSESDVSECHYSLCVAGTRSVGIQCEACGINTFSNVSGAAVCTSCDTLLTGTYQAETGQTACNTCLSDAAVTSNVCFPGTALVQNFERFVTVFNLYTAEHGANISNYLHGICTRGYGCLPCEPGHYESSRACLPCAFGSYQSNFGAQECNACAEGQNTTSAASTRASDCVCLPGFE